MTRSTLPRAAAMGIATLIVAVLAGCSAPAPAKDPGEPKRGSVPAATAEYVSCLNDEGIDAIVDQNGRVAYGIGEASGGASVSSEGAPDDARAEAERICAERVPAYTAPDDNER